MTRFSRFALSALAPLVLATAAEAAEPRTAAVVIAADDAWLRAEIRGDARALETLLAPGYRTVGVDGKVISREALLAGAVKRGYSAERAQQVAAWKASHPTKPSVTLFNDTAVLTWLVDAPDAAGPVSSCDVFVYEHGAWRAVYSQHSTASA